jgi:uncharacterized protein (UPF0548 family)
MTAVLQPRWLVGAPSAADVSAFLRVQTATDSSEGFSYSEVGASRHNAERPRGYDLDHNRIQIGEGTADFEAACAAIRAWRMFPAPWTRISPTGAPIQVGQVVAMQARVFGIWWLNACRVVYVIGEHGPVQRFGFAYGTLAAHVEQGEERFSVEMQSDGSVWYDLRAFSRPRYWPVRIAKKIVRRLQARFVRESQVSMRAAVAAARSTAVMRGAAGKSLSPA